MIKIAKNKDTSDLLRIEKDSFIEIDQFSKKIFLYHIKKGKVFICTINDEIAGYIILIMYKNCIRIYSIAVAKKYRNKGIGAELVQYVIHMCNRLSKRKILLEVRDNNFRAIKFYEKLGFQNKGILKNYYPDATNAYKLIYLVGSMN